MYRQFFQGFRRLVRERPDCFISGPTENGQVPYRCDFQILGLREVEVEAEV